MQLIEIHNIGPLVETGRIPVSQIMLLVGEQSTGKSTFMKILCFCSWLEKQVMIDEKNAVYKYTHYNRFWKELKKFHHFNDEFFSESSYIKYEGDAVQIEMRGKKRNARINLVPNFNEVRHNTKLSFLPSERNLLSSIQNIESLYRSKDMDVLFNYILEFGEARAKFDDSNPLLLVFANQMKYHYDKKNGDVLTLADGRSKIKPYYASSGVQSALPIQVLATYLANSVGTSAKISPMEYLSHVIEKEKKIDKNALSSIVQALIQGGVDVSQKMLDAFPTLESAFREMQNRSQYKSFHLFVEELEQNLFPKAQFDLIKLLVHLLVQTKQKQQGYLSSVFLTTHSPYVLTALNVMMLASVAWQKNADAVKTLGLDSYVLPAESYSAYRISDGRFIDILDKKYKFIKGEYLDSISEDVDEYTYKLNGIIYGNTEGQA